MHMYGRYVFCAGTYWPAGLMIAVDNTRASRSSKLQRWHDRHRSHSILQNVRCRLVVLQMYYCTWLEYMHFLREVHIYANTAPFDMLQVAPFSYATTLRICQRTDRFFCSKLLLWTIIAIGFFYHFYLQIFFARIINRFTVVESVLNIMKITNKYLNHLAAATSMERAEDGPPFLPLHSESWDFYLCPFCMNLSDCTRRLLASIQK